MKKPASRVRPQEKRLRAALRAGRVYMFDWNLKTDCVLRSESAVDILGSKSACQGRAKRYFEMVHPQDRDLLKQKLFELGPRRKSLSLEYRLIRGDGSILWLHDSGEGEFDDEGTLVRLHGVTADITWRKRVEEISREQERQARILLDAVPLSALLLDPLGKVIAVNRIAAVALGTNPDEMIARNAYSYLESDIAVSRRARVEQVCRTGEPVRFQDRRFGRLVDNFVHPVKGPDGKVRFLAVFGADITEQQEAQEQLRIDEERLQQAVRVAGLGIFEHDQLTDKLEWSPELRRMYGVSADRVPSIATFLDCVHPDDRQRIAEAIQSAHAPEGSGVYAVEHRVVWPDGTVRWLSQRAQTFFEGQGAGRKPVRTVGAVVDITDQKGSEEALRNSERLYRAIGETIDYGVWVCAPDGRNLYASDSFLKLVGLTQQQCSDFGWGSVLHPEDAERTIAAWKECVRTGGAWDIEHRFRGVDGQWHSVLARGVPVRDEKGNVLCWAGLNLDISRLKATEELLREAKEQLAEINTRLEHRVLERTKSLQQTTDQLNAFVYTIAHDLRAPLRAQIAFATLLLNEHAAELTARAREFATKILQAAERQGNLLTDLLTHISLERTELPLRPVQLRAAWDQVCLEQQQEISASGATVNLDGVTGTIWANESSLHLVLSNLLGNALKFVPPGRKPAVRIYSEVREQTLPFPPAAGKPRPQVARLWVEDNGIGIEPRYFDKLFRVFQRLHPGDRYPGTGIGLALVKKAVERMGGAVGLDSEPGKGSRFWIDFAVAHPSDPPTLDPNQFDLGL